MSRGSKRIAEINMEVEGKSRITFMISGGERSFNILQKFWKLVLGTRLFGTQECLKND